LAITSRQSDGDVEAPSRRRRRHVPELLEMPHELLHEERVASRFPVDRLDRLLRKLEAAPARGECGQLGGVETSEADPNGRPVPLEVAEDRRQGVPLGQLAATIGADHEHAVERSGGELAKQEQRGAVRPVEVVEHEQQRLTLGEALDEIRDRREQPAPLHLRLAGRIRREPRNARSQLGHQTDGVETVAPQNRLELVVRRLGEAARECLDPGAERCPILLATAVHDGETRRTAGELGRASRLADAPFAGDQDERALAAGGLVEQRREAFELLRAPDERCGCGRLGEPVRDAAGASGRPCG
jgi:hypothetical protein